MAVGKRLRPNDVARRLSALLMPAEDSVQGLWMTTNRDAFTFWVLTRPIEADVQRRIYGRTAALYDEFPELRFEVRVLNPSWFVDGDALSALPPDAQPIVSPAA
jgi:hypothetical protein